MEHRPPFLPIILTSLDDVTQKFRASIDTTPPEQCWIWRGAFDSLGYPVINLRVAQKTQPVSARRLSIYLSGIDLPEKRTVVRLTCGNNSCVSPSHLRVGNIFAVSDTPPYLSFEHLSRRFTAIPKAHRDNGCIEWLGGNTLTGGGGYGRLLCKTPLGKRRYLLAHRVAIYLKTRVWPSPSQFVCHHCDNPPCVNAEHLYVGTSRDNADDVVRRKRHHRETTKAKRAEKVALGCNRTPAAQAARIARRVLTDAQVEQIRSRWSDRREGWLNGTPRCTCKWNVKSIACRFSISSRCVSDTVAKGEHYVWQKKTKVPRQAILNLWAGSDGHAQCIARSRLPKHRWSIEMLMQEYQVSELTLYNVIWRTPPYDAPDQRQL